MRFSIVTPAYNVAQHLREMLDSVRRQSLYDWELRIVDDGSTDDTRKIIEAAAIDDPRIKPLFLDENSGSCFFPRRVAIERSEGDYIVNIDADDIVDKDYLYILETKIRETGADLVYADMYRFEEDKQPVKIIPRETYDTQTFSGKSIFNKTLDKWMVSGVGATNHSLALTSLQLYDYEFSLERYWGAFHNEVLTRLDLYLADKVAFAPALYLSRQYPQALTQEINQSNFELIEADENLCLFTLKYFGMESKEYTLANLQLFNHLIKLIRLLNQFPSFNEDHNRVYIIKKALSKIDYKVLQNIVPKNFIRVMQMGYFCAKKFFLVYYGKN